MANVTEIKVSSKEYADHDDCLSAAAQDYAEEHGLESWQVEARWSDDANREEIVLTVPESVLTQYARLTSADNGCDLATAVRMMRDEIGEVARETGLDESAIRDWCAAQS